MTSPYTQIAEAFLRMRTPLARVELAASRLAREANTPAARGLATGISDAVQEIDREIVRSLKSLRPSDTAEADPGDCREVLPALRSRMEAVLTAHDIRWTEPNEADAPPGDTAPVFGDRVIVAQGALVLLRAGIALAGTGGAVALELQSPPDEDRVGLWLDVARSPAAARREESTPDPLARPLSFALKAGGTLDVQHRDDRVRATLWFGAADPA